MVDKAKAAGGPNEAGEQTTKPNKLHVVAPGAGYSDEPPRMIVALHDAPCDPPEHTVFEKDGNMVHEASDVAAKAVSEILDAIRKGVGVDLDALWKSQASQTTLWSEDGSLDETWAKRFSERYFGITYGGPGQAYFGDGAWDPFIFSRAQYQARQITCLEQSVQKGQNWVKQRRGTQQVGTWQKPEDITVVQATPGQVIWGPFQPNTDPCIAIIGACQQTSSYGAVTRGFFVEDHLSYAGYAASENTRALAMFDAGGVLPVTDAVCTKGSPRGTFYSVGMKLKNGAMIGRTSSGGLIWRGDAKPNPKDPQPPPDPPTSYVTLADLRRVDYATDPENLDPVIAPGTIITFNPHGFVARVEGLYLYRFELEEWGSAMKVRTALCRTLHGDPTLVSKSEYVNPSRTKPDVPPYVAPPTRRDGVDIPKDEWQALDAKKKAQHAAWEKEERPTLTGLDLPKSIQDPGSHIAFVLRVSKEKDPKKKLIQMFDTGNVVNYWILEAEGQRGAIVRPIAAGIFDGCAIPNSTNPDRKEIPENSSPTTGIGVVPAPDKDAQTKAIAALEKARPIGLLRLVILMRRIPPAAAVAKQERLAAAQAAKTGGLDLGASLDAGHAMWGYGARKTDVLYMSRLLRMYGDDPSQNFYLSRLIWSLRNTPYFTNIQPIWFVFAPKGVLAKSMWASGARTMTVQNFTDTVLPLYQDPGPPPKDGGNPFRNAKALAHQSHYQMTHVITNSGSEIAGKAGRSYMQARSRASMGDSGGTSMTFEGWGPSKEIVRLLETWPATQSYTHPSIKGDVAVDPKSGPPAPAAAPSFDWFTKG